MKLREHVNADDNLIVPLPEIVIKQYFGDNSYHKLKKGQSVREKKAYSTVNGYRSALKDHYTFRKVSTSDQIAFDEFVQPFLAGIVSSVMCRCAWLLTEHLCFRLRPSHCNSTADWGNGV